MKVKEIISLFLFISFLTVNGYTQTENDEKKAIKSIIQEAYIGGAFNDEDTGAMKRGFHESFTVQTQHDNRFTVLPLAKWMKELDGWKSEREDWNNRTSAEITVLGIEGKAAVARVELYMNKEHEYTDFLSLYKFEDDWKITNKIFSRIVPPYAVQSQRVEAWENRINEERQPPEQVMDAIGVKPGMVIGEVGAGRGRYTVHLARRVGDKGKIYANDIDQEALAYLRERCRQNNILNIDTVQGDADDPLLPEKALDMVIMVWVYHMLDQPIPLLKNLKPSLRPGATLVILDPPDSEIDEEIVMQGGELSPDRPTIRERIEKGAAEAGFELIRTETFLPKDVIYILRVKSPQ